MATAYASKINALAQKHPCDVIASVDSYSSLQPGKRHCSLAVRQQPARNIRTLRAFILEYVLRTIVLNTVRANDIALADGTKLRQLDRLQLRCTNAARLLCDLVAQLHEHCRAEVTGCLQEHKIWRVQVLQDPLLSGQFPFENMRLSNVTIR